jgi:hypothetical protein
MPNPVDQLHGREFAIATLVACVVAAAWVYWKYIKHTYLIPQYSPPHYWIAYLVLAVIFLARAAATRFGTKP